MFEKFNPDARRVVVLTQEASRELGHDYIGTEHIMLALIRAEDSIAGQALASLGLDFDQAREKVISVIGRGAGQAAGHIPFTPRAKKILEMSLREALQLGHKYLGSEHILLGLLREGEGIGAQILNELGIELEPVRVRIVEMVGTGDSPLPAITGDGPGTILTRYQPDPALVSVVFLLVALAAVQIEAPTPDIARWGLSLLLGGALLWAGGSVIGTGPLTSRGALEGGRYLRILGVLTLAAAASVFVLGALLS